MERFIKVLPYILCFLLLVLLYTGDFLIKNDLEKATKRIERLEKIEKEPYARQDSIMNEHLDRLESKIHFFLSALMEAKGYTK